jgi:uncharacterized protein YceH (UPF0502 family)
MDNALNFTLTPTEIRVLGSLVEKDITTPDYYPLSLNALVNACNQKNNREPVTNLTEDEVRQALGTLQEKRLAGPASADSRVTKYEHRLQEVFNFTRGEIAVMCVMLLRGPQTPGELRGRTERMFHFETLDDVQSTLQRLIQRDPSLVKMLARQPGTKENRYMHLLAGDIAGTELHTPNQITEHIDATELPAISAQDKDRLGTLEKEMSELKSGMAELRQQFADFRKQFE